MRLWRFTIREETYSSICRVQKVVGGRGYVKGGGSCDQDGCQRSLQEDQIQGTKIQVSAVRLPSRRLGASLDLGSLNLAFLEAALAANLITASRSLQKRQKVE